MPETEVDLKEFFQYSRPRKAPCRIGAVVMPQLSKPEQKKLQAALDTHKDIITASAVIEWLKKRGINDVTVPSMLQGHRKHTCSCFANAE